MLDVLSQVTSALLIALIVSPAAAAYRFPEWFNGFADKIVNVAAVSAAVCLAAVLGYAAGVLDQRRGTALTDAQIDARIWLIVPVFALIVVYMLVLNRTVARWSRSKRPDQ